MNKFEEQSLTKEELREIILNLRETLGNYEEMDREVEAQEVERKRLKEEQKKLREEELVDKQVSVNFPSWVYQKLEEEFVPLMKEKITLRNNKNRFCVSHALRYLGYFALKYPGVIKGVSLADLKTIYKDEQITR